MEKERSNFGTYAVLEFCIILLLFLGGYFVYVSMSNKKSSLNNYESAKQENAIIEDSNENVKFSMNNIKGQYVVQFSDLKTENGSSYGASVTLNLYDNGIFTYTFSQMASHGILGNYYVNDNNVILVTWFNTTSSTDIFVAKGQKILSINTDGTIGDNSVKESTLVLNGVSSIVLKKTDAIISSYEPTDKLVGGCLNPREDGCCRANASDSVM